MSVTDEMLDETGAALAAMLNTLLASLPKDDPAYMDVHTNDQQLAAYQPRPRRRKPRPRRQGQGGTATPYTCTLCHTTITTRQQIQRTMGGDWCHVTCPAEGGRRKPPRAVPLQPS